MNQTNPARNRIRNGLLAASILTLGALPAFAQYTDADDVVTAVNGIPAQVTTAFLAAAALGVAFLLVRMVGKGLKKGVNIG